MSRALSCIRAASLRSLAVAVIAAGCAAANNATSAQASSQGEQPYKTMYGITSEGTTTDLYTELFGPSQPAPAPATAVASAQPVQPVTSQPIARRSQTAATPNAAVRQARRDRDGPRRPVVTPQPAPQPAPVQVAQQPAPPPAPPPEPDVPTAYGIPPTAIPPIFTPRSSDPGAATANNNMSGISGAGADVRRACRRLCIGPCRFRHRADGARHLALRRDAGCRGPTGADLLHHRPDLDDAFDVAVDRLQAGVALSGRRTGRRADRHLLVAYADPHCSSSRSASCF